MPTERTVSNNRQSSEISDIKVEEIAKKLADELFIEPTDLQVRPIVDALLKFERETRRETLLEAREKFLDARTAKEFGDWLERNAKEGM